MLEELLVEEARERKRIFENIHVYLERIVEVMRGIDAEAEIYLFGSVAEGRYLLSSDIDILVVTNTNPGRVLAELWANGIKNPFEIHVINREVLEVYKKRSKLVKLAFPALKG